MRLWGLGAVVLLALAVAGCGGGSTAVGVAVIGPVQSPMTVLVGQSVQFSASVAGGSTTTVFWQICLPAATPNTQPTNCTAGQSLAKCTIPTVSSPLTGYGTITANGLYTAPSTVPTPNNAVVVATSCVSSKAFGIFAVIIDSGIRVHVSPPAPTMGLGETLQFTATVTGTTNTGVSWTLSTSALNPPPLGSISPSGFYTAPGSAVTVTVTAQSAADASQKGTATVTVAAGTPPTLASIDPTVAAQGSAQQDVYLLGSNFLTTETVMVKPPAQPLTPVPTTFLSATLLRATIPAAQLTQAGTLDISVQMQNGFLVGPLSLNVFPVRPALVASLPDSVPQLNANAAVGLTGGYFSPGGTIATFNGFGAGQGAVTTVNSSRQASLSITGTAAGSLGTPGLYPVVVQNSGIAAISAVNLAVTPDPALIPGAPALAVSVGPGGSSPSAVAMDESRGIAVVANTGGNSVSLVNLLTHAVVTIPVGNQPTGVAVDDFLADPVALVVNSADQTVTAVDLVTLNQTTLNISIVSGPNPPLPFSIGVNPLTHRAIVTYQSTNEATILNVTVAAGTPALSIVQQVGGSSSFYGTGVHPAVGIDPRLNWAVVTPGGGGAFTLVDLGVAPGPAEPNGRAPQIVGALSISTNLQGVGINPETHQALLTDPQAGGIATLSLLNNTVSTVLQSGLPVTAKGFVAAATTPLENVGIAVNGTNATAAIVDLKNAVVLQTVNSLGSSPVAVAIDPATNQAVVVDQGGNQVFLVSLGPAVHPLQIVQSSPAMTLSTPGVPSADLTLTIIGSGFAAGSSQVLLDGTALATANVVSARQIIATVPGPMLDSPRRYIVQVQNSDGTVSNVTDLTVVQAVTVGTSPIGVAVDTDRDLAVITNSGSGTASLVSLAPPSAESPASRGAIGTIGAPVLTGTTPRGVAVIPRLGLAVVANFGSNNATIVDVTGVNPPQTIALCGSSCTGPTGVAINQDTAIAAITNTNGNSSSSAGTISLLSVSGAPALVGSPTVDQNPVAVAIDPTLNFAGVATASTTSSVDLINMTNGSIAGRAAGSGMQNPTGIVFDPINQVFVAANSLLNNVVIIDPATFLQTPVRVGIAPMSLDYNFQTSTLVTVNPPSHTMSVVDYVCPPTASAASCPGPSVRTVIGLGGTQTAPPVLGPNAVAIDPKLNLAVLADPDNNRVLLVPLPH